MKTPAFPKRSVPRQMLFYLTALAVYTLLIYGPFLGQGGGAEIDSASSRVLSPALSAIIEWQQHAFQQHPALPRAINLILLYLCSVCVFIITWLLVGRPLWLASFAAVLFMANPVKAEVVFDPGGMVALIPALCALLTMTLCTVWIVRGGWGWCAGAFLSLLITLWVDTAAGAMLLPLLLLLMLTKPSMSTVTAKIGVGAGLAAGLLAWIVYRGGLQTVDLSLISLVLVLYPIGLLPNTVDLMERYPWTGVLAAVLSVLLVAAVYRKSRHPALLIGTAGAAGFWLLTAERTVDLVTMTGGGRLLIPAALLHIALAAVCRSITQHPKWVRPMVLITALWCLVYFGLIIRAGILWSQTGAQSVTP